ncbi:MAG: hypothetical protein CL910_04865 [Deltaproteobacteria bacterium]|nr:hypothetical protein [Deltaproteobacteria bacterium]
MSTSERRSVETRGKILEIAEQEFAREGYAGAHLQRIASQVGVQKTALYYYFDSKAALFESVLAGMMDFFDARIAEVLDLPGTHAERLIELVDRMNDLLAERPAYAQVLIRIFIDQYEITSSEILNEPIERVIGRLLRFLKSGMEAGEFVRVSSRHLLTSTLGAVVFHYATGPIGSAMLGVEDLFSKEVVDWRRQEMRGLVRRAFLKDRAAANA